MAKVYETGERVWVVTVQGHRDRLNVELCTCKPKLMGLLIACEECGTVYGSVRENMNWGRGVAEHKHR